MENPDKNLNPSSPDMRRMRSEPLKPGRFPELRSRLARQLRARWRNYPGQRVLLPAVGYQTEIAVRSWLWWVQLSG